MIHHSTTRTEDMEAELAAHEMLSSTDLYLAAPRRDFAHCACSDASLAR